jgi:hypothetical protein
VTRVQLLKRSALTLWVGRNVVGAITAGPVLWAMYEKAGPFMAAYLLFCCVAGCVLTTVMPLVGYRLAQRAYRRFSLKTTGEIV